MDKMADYKKYCPSDSHSKDGQGLYRIKKLYGKHFFSLASQRKQAFPSPKTWNPARKNRNFSIEMRMQSGNSLFLHFFLHGFTSEAIPEKIN